MVYVVVTVKFNSNLDGTLVKELKIFDTYNDASKYYNLLELTFSTDSYIEELDLAGVDAKTAQTIYDTLTDV